ncbi:hypothetical protein FNV43_RR25274 [Rhamnella rubrinervis]|uniref:Uncharacterized protein n=1 Tax=Rhamnella rubrinervis TaxID=2594499 RepID=A0A8K0GR03_9ROSA|nr:hypothetical protein FNV43_RR25274 [Rhamnella rubrinervis]
MSVFSDKFGGGAICGDYFGDELGVPLPPPNSLIGNKVKVATKAMDQSKPPTIQPQVQLTNKSSLGSKQQAAPALLAFSPALDGLHCFETFFFL